MGIIAKPHTFSPNTTATSSEVNSDFDTIYNEFNGNIAAANLATDAVTTSKIADSNVTTAKIADSNVTTAKINADAVTATKIDWASTGADGGIWWEELGRTTLGSAGDTISLTSIPARKYLQIKVIISNTGGNVSVGIRFNNDTGNNYASTINSNGATDVDTTSDNEVLITGSSNIIFQILTIDLVNIATFEKKLSGFRVQGTAGAANAPGIAMLGGKWANTTDQVTRVDIVNLAGAGDFASGSEVVVLGHN